jgi:hypothetical protein
MAKEQEFDPRNIDISGKVEKYKKNDDGTHTIRISQEPVGMPTKKIDVTYVPGGGILNVKNVRARKRPQ